jgi:hypothetical protein
MMRLIVLSYLGKICLRLAKSSMWLEEGLYVDDLGKARL